MMLIFYKYYNLVYFLQMLVQEISFLRVLNLQSKSLLNGKRVQIGQIVFNVGTLLLKSIKCFPHIINNPLTFNK